MLKRRQCTGERTDGAFARSCARPLQSVESVNLLPPPRSFLVFEDDARLRNGLGELLWQSGYEVVAASNGAVALELLRSRPSADLILRDLRMPGMNGWQLRSELQRDASLASIPVVVGSADWNAEAEAETLGAVSCLRKPYSARDLVETVRRFAAA